MQNGIDTWFLESMFAHFRMAAHLVDNIDDTIVADELAKSISEISRRVAALLGKPYGPPAEGESPGSQAAGEPTKDGESDEPDLANMLDDVCDSVARADAFASAAKSLIREIQSSFRRGHERWSSKRSGRFRSSPGSVSFRAVISAKSRRIAACSE